MIAFSIISMAQMRNYNTNFEYSLQNFVDTIPIEVENNQLFVRVQMGGKWRRMCLDTGSSQGAVYAGAHLQGLQELGNVVSRDAAGHRDTVRVVQMPPFQLGKLSVSGYVASVYPRRHGRQQYDGILGFDMLNKGLCCKIDVRQGFMVLTDRRDFFDDEPGYGIRYKLK